MEQFPTDTVDYADIVLPATMQTEHLDVNDGYGHMYVSLNRPAVEPPGECVSTTETFRRIARAMGLDGAVAVRRRRDAVPDAARRRALRAAVGRGLDAARVSAAVRAVHGRLPDAVGEARVRVAARRSTDGLDLLPGYTPPALAPSGTRDHPLALIAPASHWFLNTVFANKPDLMKRAGEPRITLHPDDAVMRGLSDGDVARVFNARGSFVADGRGVRCACGPASSPRPRATGSSTCAAARTSTRPSRSATRTWAAAPSSTTTAWRWRNA